MSRPRKQTLREKVKLFAVVTLMVLLAPLLAAWLGIQHVRQRPIVERLRRDKIDDLRILSGDLVITRAGALERVPLADLTRGEWTLVDYGGAFADAGECGVLLDFERANGPPIALSLAYYLPSHPEQLIRPLQERGLLSELPGETRLNGKFQIAIVTVLVAAWILIAMVIAAIWLGSRR